MNASGLPRAPRLNTATLSSEKDARSISIRVAVVERLIERKLFVFQNLASFLDDEDLPSHQVAGLDIEHACLFLPDGGAA